MVIGLLRFATVIVTVMFCRVESKLTVAFPEPEAAHAGVSCDEVSTAPSVCAETLPAMRRKAAKATKRARPFISPPDVWRTILYFHNFNVANRTNQPRLRLGRGAAAARIAIMAAPWTGVRSGGPIFARGAAAL